MMLEIYTEGKRYDMLTANSGEENKSKAIRHLEKNEVCINMLATMISDIGKRIKKYENKNVMISKDKLMRKRMWLTIETYY